MARRRGIAIPAPSRVRSRIPARALAGVLILALICVIVLAVAAGFFTFRITTEHNDVENVTPSSFLLTNFENLPFTDHNGGEHDGWLLRGLKGAPVVILCPGYDSNRSELLSLGAVLQENHFNVYAFSFHGPKTKQAISDLGGEQAEELQAAIQMITKRPEINPHRVGIYGATTGGYAALVTAQESPLVKAIVVDSVYEQPVQMFDSALSQLLGGPSPSFQRLAEIEFDVVTHGSKIHEVRANLSKLQDMPKLFIEGRDTPVLASTTEELYGLAPQPKRLLIQEHSQPAQASGAEKKEYENQVLSFFLQNLPLRAD
jgi:esterase/lipase